MSSATDLGRLAAAGFTPAEPDAGAAPAGAGQRRALPYQVNAALMRATGKQAENRLHTIKAGLVATLS